MKWGGLVGLIKTTPDFRKQAGILGLFQETYMHGSVSARAR